jgi:mycoredoxin
VQRYLWVAVVAFGLYAAASIALDGQWPLAALVAMAAGTFAWWSSPWKGGRSPTHREVMAMPEQDRPVIVYWRPGCGFCARLRSALGSRAEQAHWVNIWQDPEAAAYVRGVNDGNEVVPTVVIDGRPFTNPDPSVVLEALEPRPA